MLARVDSRYEKSLKLESIIHEINKRAATRPIGHLQEIRKEIKRLKRRPCHDLFPPQTILPKSDPHYAFHFGGRTELQFNVGFDRVEGVTQFRWGAPLS